MKKISAKKLKKLLEEIDKSPIDKDYTVDTSHDWNEILNDASKDMKKEKKKKKAKYTATVTIGGEKIKLESNVIPFCKCKGKCVDHWAGVDMSKLMPTPPTQDSGHCECGKLKKHTREEARAFFKELYRPKSEDKDEAFGDCITELLANAEPLTEENMPEELKMACDITNKVHKKHNGKDWRGVYKCPKCGGKLHLSHSKLNGHVHGSCETKGCLGWIE